MHNCSIPDVEDGGPLPPKPPAKPPAPPPISGGSGHDTIAGGVDPAKCAGCTVDAALPIKSLHIAPGLDPTAQTQLVKSSGEVLVAQLTLQTEQAKQTGALKQETLKQDATVDQEIVKQLGANVGVLLLLIAVAIFIRAFQKPIAAFLERLNSATLKTGGGEVTLLAQEVGALVGAEEAKTAAQEAAADAPPPAAGGAPAPVPIPAAALVVPKVEAAPRSARFAAEAAPRLKNRTLLWVDDHPENNSLLARAFEALGIRVERVRSTEEAMASLNVLKVDMAITDMSRGDDREAGLGFVTLGLQARPGLKIAVYASRRASDRFERARKLGASLATSSPTEIFDHVVSQLG